jgi:Holliday junction DNA helicase RuvA
MYDYLEGRAVTRAGTRLVLEVGGVGYDLVVPLGADFPVREDRTRAWTHLVVREDAHLLYGFPDPRRREVFRLLLSAKGVGPGVALSLLSRMTSERLLAAVVEQDVAALRAVRGIGEKTARQILLDLREKGQRLLASAAPGDGGDVLVPAPPPASAVVEDAVVALVSIGYTDKEARRNVEKAATRVGADDLEALVRSALRE